MSAYDVLRRVLSDRPIAFHPELARAFGGINEALFFQQIAYWSDKGDDPEWIYKSQVELEAETCLSAYQQKQARDHLKRLGVLQDARRGVPARLYYRIDWDATFRFLETANLDSSADPSFRETANLDSEKPASKDAGNSQSISESTQRAQAKSPFEISKGLSEVVSAVLSEIDRKFPASLLAGSSESRYAVSWKLGSVPESRFGVSRNLNVASQSMR